MQIFKLLPIACAVGICVSFISVRAQDTPVQAAAREALEQKMQELDAPKTQAPPRAVASPGAVKVQPNQLAPKTVPAKAATPAATATAPAATATAPAATATVPAAVVTVPAATATTTTLGTNAAPAASETTPAAPVATTPAETIPATPPPAETKPAPMVTPVEPAAAAIIATETNAVPEATETTPAAPVVTVPAEVAPATPPPTETKPAPVVETAQPAPVIITAAGVVPPKATPGVMSATNQINAIFPGKELGLKPIEAPLLPVTATQQAQLQALLEKYKANQISPEEYHRQRAEILAQP